MKEERWFEEPTRLSHPDLVTISDCEFGVGVHVRQFCNLYSCRVGRDTIIGAYTEIGSGVVVGANCKIGARVFIPPGVKIEDKVFIGPGVIFTNDKYPRAWGDWTKEYTYVKKRASIGAGCVILPGLTIGAGALVGAGTVVTHSIPPNVIMRHDFTNVKS